MNVFDRLDEIGSSVNNWIGDSGSRFIFAAVFGMGALVLIVTAAVLVCVHVFSSGPNCPPGTTPQTYTEGYGKTRSTYDYCLAVR